MTTKQDGVETTTEKVRKIGMILGMMEETNRNKGWILQQIKKHDLNLPITPDMNSYKILDCCTIDFIDLMLQVLRGDDISSPKDVQTKVYHWFFSDIVAGSNPLIPTKSQVRKIVILNELILRTDAFKERDTANTIILPTGDGMAIGFGDSPERPLLLTIELYKSLYKYNATRRGNDKLLLRVGIESGPVYFVKDLEGKDNVWGPGIIMTRHVMDKCGDMQIYVASRIAEELVRISPKYKDLLHHVEDYETKYGEKIQLYNVYGKDFGSKTAPVKPKKTNLQQPIKSGINFSFDEIQVILDILDKNTILVHHIWIWDVVNISNMPKSQIFYYIEGHTPKDFGALNLKVTDESNNRLEISEIKVNKPYRKEFNVLLAKPVMPKEKTTVKLQYDWESPDRVFSYKFPSKVKKFSYTCTLPKDIDLKNRILKVDTGTGYKIHATPPATIKRYDDKVVIMWEKRNIVPPDAYQFQW